MSTIAEMSVPAKEFALHSTLEALPDTEFEIQSIVARDSDRVVPFLWATSDHADQATVTEALADDMSVENILELAAFDDEWFYQMSWVEDIRIVLHVLVEHEATILNADGRNDEWHFRILFPRRESLSATYDYCQDENLSVKLGSVYALDNENRDEYGLTEPQHETLITAVEQGYFDIPQQVTMDDLAEQLDVSHQALSERLHRGHKTLIQNALIVGRMGE
jgi:predicted DNA binding protein